MCNLSSAENQGEFERIAVFQEALTLFDLRIDVVLVDANGQTNPFHLTPLLVGFLLLVSLSLTVQVLSKVHDAAHRREHRGRHLNQIKSHLFGQGQRFRGAHHASLHIRAIFSDQPYGLRFDLFVSA